MIVSNLPHFTEDTNLKSVVMKIADQVGYKIGEEQIQSVYQNHNKKFNTHPLIVKLATNDLKQKCIQFRKNNRKIDIKKIGSTLNNDDKNINFHHLIEREYAELLQMAKEEAKKAGFKFVWYKDSCILARKAEDSTVIRINSQIDLVKSK